MDPSNNLSQQIRLPKPLQQKVFVIDSHGCKGDKVDINGDGIPETPHGEVAKRILADSGVRATLQYTDAKHSNLSRLISKDSALTHEKGIVSLSIASELDYETISKITGIDDLGPSNISEYRKEVIEKLKRHLKTPIHPTDLDPEDSRERRQSIKDSLDVISAIEKAAERGTKVFVALGNTPSDTVNLYSLAEGATVVGIDIEEEQRPYEHASLINMRAPGTLRIRELNNGYDINQNGTVDFTKHEAPIPEAIQKYVGQLPENACSSVPKDLIESLRKCPLIDRSKLLTKNLPEGLYRLQNIYEAFGGEPYEQETEYISISKNPVATFSFTTGQDGTLQYTGWKTPNDNLGTSWSTPNAVINHLYASLNLPEPTR